MATCEVLPVHPEVATVYCLGLLASSLYSRIPVYVDCVCTVGIDLNASLRAAHNADGDVTVTGQGRLVSGVPSPE